MIKKIFIALVFLSSLSGLNIMQAQPARIIIRGIPYEDHSSKTRLSKNNVFLGEFFSIFSSTLRYNRYQDIRVVMEDVQRSGGFGVTIFRLTNVRFSGKTLTAQIPMLAFFRNRTFAITVFVFERGQPNRYAAPGYLRIR